MARPKGNPVLWSSDTLYPAGGNAWNNTATKVAPSLSKIQGGFQPDERPPAQHVNHILNANANFLNYIDVIEVLNWKGPFITDGPAENGINKIVFNRFNNYFWGAGYYTNIYGAAYKSKTGQYFTNDATFPLVSGDTILDAATNDDPAEEQTAFVGHLDKLYRYRDDHATSGWGTIHLNPYGPAVATTHKSCIYDTYSNQFVVGGDTDVGGGIVRPTVKYGNPGSTFLSQTLADPGYNNGNIDYLAIGPSYKIAIPSNTGGAPLALYYTNPSVYTLQLLNGAGGAPSLTACYGFVYSETEDLFMILGDNGKVVTFTSPTSIVNYSTVSTGFTWANEYCLAVLGSVFLAAITDPLGNDLLVYSTDRGATWNKVSNPSDVNNVGQGKIHRVGSTGADNRFYVICINSFRADVSFSLRVK